MLQFPSREPRGGGAPSRRGRFLHLAGVSPVFAFSRRSAAALQDSALGRLQDLQAGPQHQASPGDVWNINRRKKKTKPNQKKKPDLSSAPGSGPVLPRGWMWARRLPRDLAGQGPAFVRRGHGFPVKTCLPLTDKAQLVQGIVALSLPAPGCPHLVFRRSPYYSGAGV